ncbi:xurface protein [Colletotrichum kahawae]|uniref:Xurface protein n=1 Tax=Colletotrichum kahawae TaxID=34407 RepID=A0AAD9YIS9_COLKA|nr:xurface protein [Colletotrichum kahawae]
MSSHPQNPSYSAYAGLGSHTQPLHPTTLRPGVPRPSPEGNGNSTYDRQSQLDVTIGSAEHVFTCLRGGRGLACPHFPKYTAGNPTVHREYPSRLGFFHASNPQGFISYLETGKLCPNCLDQVVPNGYTYWTMIPSGDGKAIEGHWLDTAMSSQMYPRLYQSGTERFDQTTVRPQSIPDNLITQPKDLPIPQIAEAHDAWRWMQSQRKPFYIDALHLTNGWTPFAELSAQEDSRIVRRSRQSFVMSRPSGAIQNFAQRHATQDHAPLHNMDLSSVSQKLSGVTSTKGNYKQSTPTAIPISIRTDPGITATAAPSITRKAVPGTFNRPDLSHASSVPDMQRRAVVAASTATYSTAGAAGSQTVLVTNTATSTDSRLRPTSTNGMRAVSQPGFDMEANVNQRPHALGSSNRPSHGSLQDMKHISAGLPRPQSSSRPSSSMSNRPVPSTMSIQTGDIKQARWPAPTFNTIIATGVEHPVADQNLRPTEGSVKPPPRQANKPTGGKREHMSGQTKAQGTGQASVLNSRLQGSGPDGKTRPPDSTRHHNTSWYRHDPIDFDELDSGPTATVPQQLPATMSGHPSPLPRVLEPGSGTKAVGATRGLDTTQLAELFRLFQPNAETRPTQPRMLQKTSNKVTSGIPPRHPDRAKKLVPTTQTASKDMVGKKTTPQLKQTQATQKGMQATPATMSAQHVPEGQPPKSAQASTRHPELTPPGLKKDPAVQKDRLKSAVDTGRPKTSADDRRATGQGQTKTKPSSNKVSGVKPTKPTPKRESGRGGSSERKGSRVSGKEKKTSRLGGSKPHKLPGKGNKSNVSNSTPGKHGGSSSHITNNSSVTNSTTNTTIHIIGGDSDKSDPEMDDTSDGASGDETDGTGEFPEVTDVDSSVLSSPIGSAGQYPPGHDPQSDLDHPPNNNGEPGQQPEWSSQLSSPVSQIGGQTPNFPGQQAHVQIHGEGAQSGAGVNTLPSATNIHPPFLSQEPESHVTEQYSRFGDADSVIPSRTGMQTASEAAVTRGKDSTAPYSTQSPLPGYMHQPVSESEYGQGEQTSFLSSKGTTPCDDQHWNPAPSWPPARSSANDNHQFSNHPSLNSGTSGPGTDSNYRPPSAWGANAIGDASVNTQGLLPGAPAYAPSEQQNSVPPPPTAAEWPPKQTALNVNSYSLPNAGMDRKGPAQDAGHISASQPGPYSNQVGSPAWPMGAGQGINQSYFSPTTSQAPEPSYDPWAPQTGASQQSKNDPWGGEQTANVVEPNSAWDSKAEPMSPGPSAKPNASGTQAWQPQASLSTRSDQYPSPSEATNEDWPNWSDRNNAPAAPGSQASQVPTWQTLAPYAEKGTHMGHYGSQPRPIEHQSFSGETQSSPRTGSKTKGLAAAGLGLAAGAAIGYGLASLSRASSTSSASSKTSSQGDHGLDGFSNQLWNNPEGQNGTLYNDGTDDAHETSSIKSRSSSSSSNQETMGWFPQEQQLANSNWDDQNDNSGHYTDMNYDGDIYRNGSQHFDNRSMASDQLSPTYYNNGHVPSPSSDVEQPYTYQNRSDNVVEYGDWPREDNVYQQSYQNQPESENEDSSDSERSVYDSQPDHSYDPQNQYFQHQGYAPEAYQHSEEFGDDQSDAPTNDQSDSESEPGDEYQYPSGNDTDDGDDGDDGVCSDDESD